MFLPTRRQRAWVLGLALVVASPARAQPKPAADAEPPPDVQAEYHAVVERAVSQFDRGHVAEARALFLRAHELWPSARTLRTLGMTAFELAMYARALRELQDAQSDPRRPLPPEQRAQVAGLIERTKGFVGSYRLQLTPATAELLVDGARVATGETLVLGLGPHHLLARALGYNELLRDLVVQGGEDEVLALQLEPSRVQQPSAASDDRSVSSSKAQAASRPNHTPAIIAFGVTGAAVITGTVSGLIAFSKKHDDADLSAGHRAADISTVSWITAGVAALAGVLFLTFEPDGEKKQVTVRTHVGPGAIQVEGSF